MLSLGDSGVINLALFFAVRSNEEVIPCYSRQLREHVQPDVITLGSLSLQQVSATKRKYCICVIIPYSPAYQPGPLCPVSLASSNGHRVHMCVYCAVCMCLSLLLFILFFFNFVPDLYL